MCLLPLTQGKFALIDQEDYARVSAFKWGFNKKNTTGHGYAQRSQHVKLAKYKYTCKTIYLHRFIMGGDLEIDHINGDTLDNRKCNLRFATRSEQMRNTRSRIGASSRHSGIHIHKATGKWRAQIKIDGKTKSLGLFLTEDLASEARWKFITDIGLTHYRK